MTRRRRSVVCMLTLFTFTNYLCSLMLSELHKTRTEQNKKRPHMRWAINDSIGLSCLFLLCSRIRVRPRKEAPRLPKQAVMVKTKMKMKSNIYLLDDNMALLTVECHSGLARPLVLKRYILFNSVCMMCVPNFPYPSSRYFQLLPLFP